MLQALITRNVLDDLPQPLDGVVAKFLGGAGQLHYWPREDEASDSVVAAVRDAFRHPVRCAPGILQREGPSTALLLEVGAPGTLLGSES